MFDKLFNRKYVKAIEEIELRIECLKGKEQYYRLKIFLNGDPDDIDESIHWLQTFIHERRVLEDTLRFLKESL